jgi:hypothetical protein
VAVACGKRGQDALDSTTSVALRKSKRSKKLTSKGKEFYAEESIEFQEAMTMPQWESDYLADKEETPDGITIDMIKALKLRAKRTVMWCLEESDINDIRNFCPAYLIKISNEQYEVMDDGDDVCLANLYADGDEGIENIWGMYVRPPTQAFVDHCKVNSLFVRDRMDGSGHEVTPRRGAARERAAQNLEKRASKVFQRVKSKCSGIVKKGDVVQIPLVPQDRGKTDAVNLTGVVVNINNNFGMCQVAVRNGVLRPWYVYHKLRVVQGLGNDRNLNGLEEAYLNWKCMAIISPREAATDQSLVGGHGIFSCKCKGNCTTDKCKCFKNNRICTSACHRNSRCCENHDEAQEGNI